MARAYTIRNWYKDPWEEGEKQFIRENYMEMSDSELSRHLIRRSPSAVRSMLQQMRLGRNITHNSELEIRSVFKDLHFSTAEHIQKILDKE